MTYLKRHFQALTEDQLQKVWEYKCGDWYEKVPTDGTWLACERCGVLPRTWIFDNGSFAKCLCYDLYDECPVRTESIMSVHKRTGLTEEYSRDKLRSAWCEFALTGVEQNKLENGRW